MHNSKNIFSTIVFSLSFALIGTASHADEQEQAKLKLLWETPPLLETPESVLYDDEQEVLYASNIIGHPWGKDNQASIAKIALDGTIINPHWVTANELPLHAPKGLALYEDKLYAADLDHIAVIDIERGKLIERIPVTGASGLNDISINEEGDIYVTDSFTSNISLIRDRETHVIATGLAQINGILATDDQLFYLSNGGLYEADLLGQNASLIASGMEGFADGVEQVEDDSWLVSCWLGVTYHVTREDGAQKLLDTRSQNIYSADLGFNEDSNTMYLPTFWNNTIQVYHVEIDD